MMFLYLIKILNIFLKIMNNFKKIIDLLLQLLLIIFSYFIKKDKNLLLFWAWVWNSFKWNTKYLFLYWIKETKFNCYWITRNKELYKYLKSNWYEVIYLYSKEWFFKILKSNVLFIEMWAQDCVYTWQIFWNFNFFNLRHWTPLKKIWEDMINENIWKSLNIQYKIRDIIWKNIKSSSNLKYISSPSNFVSNIFKNAFYNNNIYITWYPRNDIFFNDKLIIDKFYSTLELWKYKKIITYTPTFRDNSNISPFTKDFLTQGNLYFKEKNYLFLIKLHPYDKSIDLDLNIYSNIKSIDKKIDLQELLVYTDILITDYSSVFFDYMITNKPVIYYSYDYEFYIKNCRWLYLDYYKDLPWPFIKNEKDLIKCINNINEWFYDEKYQKKYIEFNNKFNEFKDWNSCERVFSLISNN